MIDLSTKIGTFKRKGTVKEVIIENINIPGNENPVPKVCLMVDIGASKLIRVNEALVYNYNQSKKQQGLWLSEDVDGNINVLSTVGKLMNKYDIKTLQDFKDKEIDLYIGEKGLLVGDTT